ncbi:N-acetylglucosamine-6-phosphate deacetylase [bacterium]|uniref:N-acetylglucosamine-6-phosphate deacetylase n=1 Tax=Lachnospiraceae TaxID=186803 RepID=UPI002A318748|nr:N-acetylglucosamine-6-phosphate deacetylase [bacterium]MDY2885766.1 N-acetylglucosamine-6-phosphate deacetylase [Bariatricus sp.]MCI7150260.1 N-acetylglucosamine-6-phosphate deacetylase [bacterium]MDD6514229.1 N-acetylglucosamine-6-phosphate deacetylase [bacterium]MDY4195182.1 N-acetylglucosamine-6-phosphate deacetylase [Bariatricus sp.]
MIIRNALVYGEDKTFSRLDIRIEEDVFTEICPSLAPSENESVLDADGLYAIPGLIDIHFHGCMGHDFCDGTVEAIDAITRYEASCGVTSVCPATMTVSPESLVQVMDAARTYNESPARPGQASLVGINMEGPFISEAKKGAQAAEHIRLCDEALFCSLQERSGGLIKLVDIAPENEGAMEFIDALHDKVTISLAHTTADYQTAKEAYDRGARHATHLYNAMPPFTHRAPGVVGAAFDSPHCRAELICDGVHIHPSVVRATFQLFGDDRMILISDSMRAAGMEDGQYTLGGQDVAVKGKYATLVSDGALAGSVTNLMDCMRTAVKEMQIPLESAIACATMNPAKAIGIYDRYGSISTGKIANLVLLDQDLNLRQVIIHG